MLTNPSARQVFGSGWATEARRVVALFRVEHDLWLGEPAFTALVERVRAACPEFKGWWSEHGVRAPVSGTKYLRHPTLGAIDYDHASFQANDDPALRLVIYTPRECPSLDTRGIKGAPPSLDTALCAYGRDRS